MEVLLRRSCPGAEAEQIFRRAGLEAALDQTRCCVARAVHGSRGRFTCVLLYKTYVNSEVAETPKCAFFLALNPVSGS